MRSTTAAGLAGVVLAAFCAAAPLAAAQPAPAPGPPPGPAEASDAGPAPAAAGGAKTTIDAAGSYAVGKDIAPGVYQSAGPTDNSACYWKRTAGDKLVDNGLTKKPATVQILPTDTTFTTSDCQAWQLTNGPLPPQPGPMDLLGQLTNLVGSGFFNQGPR
jgi:hypothetical protein